LACSASLSCSYFDVPLALAATALVAVLLGVTMLGSYRQIRQQRPLLELGGNISGLVLQLLTGIAKLQMTGSEGRDFARWAEQFSVQKALAFRVRRIGNQLNAFNAAAPLLTALVLFAVVAWHGASLSPGTFVAFYAAFAQFLVAMLAMNAAFVSVLNVIPVYERLKPILVTAPEARAERTDPGVLSGDIEINQVSFRYKADGPLALNDVSLRVRPGEFVAIVGPSGSGKSSLFRLLLGFETPRGRLGVLQRAGPDEAGRAGSAPPDRRGAAGGAPHAWQHLPEHHRHLRPDPGGRLGGCPHVWSG